MPRNLARCTTLFNLVCYNINKVFFALGRYIPLSNFVGKIPRDSGYNIQHIGAQGTWRRPAARSWHAMSSLLVAFGSYSLSLGSRLHLAVRNGHKDVAAMPLKNYKVM